MSRCARAFAVVALACACTTKGPASVDLSSTSDTDTETDTVDSIVYPDADEDSFASDVDCDDHNPLVNPGRPEVCDGADDNCDGLSDEDDVEMPDISPAYPDRDVDGAGDLTAPHWFCILPATGWVSNGTDCADNDAARRPDAIEVCDGIDDDCDGLTDDQDDSLEGAGFPTAVERYADVDADGFGAKTARWYCTEPASGVAPTNTDCNDQSATTFPGSAERESATSCRTDADGDGFGAISAGAAVGATAGSDCDDTSPVTFPGAAEHESTSSCRLDSDNDGYGEKLPPVGVVAGSDCNDVNATIYPTATEIWYDGIDTNCDGRDDFDQDRDGYDATLHPGGDDCDDLSAAIKPTATEICDTIDNNCDALIDDADPTVSVTVYWYLDRDGDSFAGKINPVHTCTAPVGGVRLADATDCDDAVATTFPGAAQRESATACRADADNDGYGALVAPSGGTAGTDCNDTSGVTFPGSAERESTTSCRTDADGDGYGALPAAAGATVGTDCSDLSAATFPGAAQVESTTSCRTDADDDGYGAVTPAAGAVVGGDCDDASVSIHPTAVDIWYDGVDQDCDGKNDWDSDGDGYEAAGGPGPGPTDCDDANAVVNPGQDEVCNRVDDDCDALIDDADPDVVVVPWGVDLDGDGAPAIDVLYDVCDAPGAGLARYDGTNADCDDQDDLTYPGAAFDESATRCMTDADLDGWGSDLPLSGVDVGTDCDDLDETRSPGAYDLPLDGMDQDCSGADTTASFTDTDHDNVSDDMDACPGGNDHVDADADGRPDACGCTADGRITVAIAPGSSSAETTVSLLHTSPRGSCPVDVVTTGSSFTVASLQAANVDVLYVPCPACQSTYSATQIGVIHAWAQAGRGIVGAYGFVTSTWDDRALLADFGLSSSTYVAGHDNVVKTLTTVAPVHPMLTRQAATFSHSLNWEGDVNSSGVTPTLLTGARVIARSTNDHGAIVVYVAGGRRAVYVTALPAYGGTDTQYDLLYDMFLWAASRAP